MLTLVLWLTAEAAVDTAPLAEAREIARWLVSAGRDVPEGSLHAFEKGDRASVSLPDTPFLLASP